VNVLVTGGAGYIGSQTAKALSRAGYQPVVVDNLTTGHRWAVRWGPLVQADLEDKDSLRAVFRSYQIQAVIHFAACAYVGESMHSPALYFRNNTVNTLNLLDVMLEQQVNTIVFSSTCAIYGEPQQIPIPEEHIQRPISPYGESKLMVERILQWYGRSYGLAWASLRYFNAAGADLDAELGEDHDPETHLIPRAVAVALHELPLLEIYGTDYDTSDGTALRDYIHVCDLSSAHISAMRHLLNGEQGLALNLGTGSGYSVREVVSMVEKVTGREVTVKECARRPGDPPALVADPHKALRLLGWRARHSSLQSIVETSWRWQSKRRQGGEEPGSLRVSASTSGR
jgi:UDP-glucose-4-epimerase GalE